MQTVINWIKYFRVSTQCQPRNSDSKEQAGPCQPKSETILVHKEIAIHFTILYLPCLKWLYQVYKLIWNKYFLNRRLGVASKWKKWNISYAAEQQAGKNVLWNKGHQKLGRPGDCQAAEADLRPPIKASGVKSTPRPETEYKKTN